MTSSLSLPTPLVSTDWLAEHLDHPLLRVVDASWYMAASGRKGGEDFGTAHIPGAVYADIDWLSDEKAPYPHTLPSPDVLASKLGALGIGNAHAVVVYDGSGQHFSAPRLWYMLRALGHESVAVLDGGFVKWRAEGRAVSSEAPSIAATTFVPQLDAARWRDITSMRANVDSHAEQVVDARSPGRFSAEEAEPRAGVRGGHIPGAKNAHYASLVQANGEMLSPDALRARFADAGLNLDAPIVCSCGSGITACAVALGLEVAGAKQVAVYDGSWTEWGSQQDTPVETGSAR
ncbi:MAG TPA: 3-mercaptopyruvate sulfurtransferase [Gemmatimonas sp.]|uniref:3-mercaptopyruvate sulfurtransferase n=1 Tax=Gemmatimonas sp. TaxID=1962908 RepID=UPI002EDA6FB2